MITAGIDAGSRTIKVVLYDSDTKTVIGSAITDQGVDQAARAERVMLEAMTQAGVKRNDIEQVVATGYGRDALAWADRTVTEITCHGRGVHAEAPEARTVIDIGGQDSKLLKLGAGGEVQDFVMNDRCAAGTGRFLEVLASRLGLQVSKMGTKSGHAAEPIAINSMCAVFAETEIVGLLAQGREPAGIVAGVRKAIASRVASMAGRTIHAPVVLTGGVALVAGMDEALAECLGVPVKVSPRPQFTGALGAAILAAST